MMFTLFVVAYRIYSSFFWGSLSYSFPMLVDLIIFLAFFSGLCQSFFIGGLSAFFSCSVSHSSLQSAILIAFSASIGIHVVRSSVHRWSCHILLICRPPFSCPLPLLVFLSDSSPLSTVRFVYSLSLIIFVVFTFISGRCHIHMKHTCYRCTVIGEYEVPVFKGYLKEESSIGEYQYLKEESSIG